MKKRYKLYTNQIFSEEKKSRRFLVQRFMKRNEQYKVVYYDKKNHDKAMLEVRFYI